MQITIAIKVRYHHDVQSLELRFSVTYIIKLRLNSSSRIVSNARTLVSSAALCKSVSFENAFSSLMVHLFVRLT
ncbi:hypothetical protein T4A_13373 [Trichinella pseudospiralis]|uniref:Uncharacterized protein n=1 Tax=Trichinella pseudospiralis TaxID=6337 RepID=A0A0V1EIC8_TRIPS|nr:hypothetical protein T4A_13373 [Trichinella pseudospiralis]